MNVQDVLPRDAIPSIDDPSFGASYFGEDGDEVLVVESEPARAYPVRILSYHEIVNDVVDGLPDSSVAAAAAPDATGDRLPIAVTWCPICASAVVYSRVLDGQVLTFGTSGKLADDALVMYDRETESEWKQPLGAAIGGPLAGRRLDVVPAATMSWERCRVLYPNAVVLEPVHGGETDAKRRSPRSAYDMTPYEEYGAGEGFGLRAMRGEGPERTWDREDIGPKAAVLGLVRGGEAVGYPLPVVRAAGGVVADSVGGDRVLVVSTGGEMHAFAHPGQRFEWRDGTLCGDGTSWDPTTGASDDGRQLRRLPARRLSAFAWQDDHGRGSFYGLE